MLNGSENEQLIDELLSRSVVEIFPSKDFLKKELMSGKKLRIYFGADATGTALHIGHATNYIILEKFRRLGHKVIVLIGDFTARIGDPTDKTAARTQLSREEVVSNTKTWFEKIAPVLDFNNKENPVEVVYNNDWLSKMTFEDVINLASNFTVQQMLERDMFEKRLEENKPIYVHEFFYPLMQGYDSVHLDVDMELCGNDQTFNALTGRTLLKRLKNKEKFVFVTTLLENPKTGKKMMSKSQGTGVFLDFSPTDMFGGIMAQPDENIPQLYTDCTFESLKNIEDIKADLTDASKNPKDLKMRLAFEITKIYHGEEKANEAKENFENTFSKGHVSESVIEIKTTAGSELGKVLVDLGYIPSRSEFGRLITAGAVSVGEGEKITDPKFIVTESAVFKVGKKNFFKIIIA